MGITQRKNNSLFYILHLKMPIRLQSTFTRFQSAGAWILHIFVSITWLTPQAAMIVLLVIIWYIVLLIIVIPVHKTLLRLMKKKTERLTWEIDTLRYLVAKAQQKSEKKTENKGIKILFDLPKPDYFHHLGEIKQEIVNIQTSLWTTIVDDVTRVRIEKMYGKRKSLNTFTNVYGRIVSAITIFVYKLFR